MRPHELARLIKEYYDEALTPPTLEGFAEWLIENCTVESKK